MSSGGRFLITYLFLFSHAFFWVCLALGTFYFGNVVEVGLHDDNVNRSDVRFDDFRSVFDRLLHLFAGCV